MVSNPQTGTCLGLFPQKIQESIAWLSPWVLGSRLMLAQLALIPTQSFPQPDFLLFCFFEMVPHYVVQAGLEIKILIW